MSLLRFARLRLLTSPPTTTFLRTFALSTPLSEAAPASILPRLKSDLKDAMRAKDKPRLDVIRSLNAEILNASKTAKPITSDTQLLSLLKKKISSSQSAISEFEAAKREDLIEKERVQVGILEAYASEIPVMKKEEVDALFEEVVGELAEKEVGEGGLGGEGEGWKPKFGPLMAAIQKKIDGRPVDSQYVNERVGEISGTPKKGKS